MHHHYQHNKKAALITGGAKRVGNYIAKVVAKEGYDVIIHYNNSKKEALQTKNDIENLCLVRCEVLQCDLLQFDSLKLLIEGSFSIFPHLKVLINNASIFKKCSFTQTTEEVFDEHMNIHVKSPFFLIKEFSKHADCSNIINIIDEFILKKGSENYFSYLLSKKSMMILTTMLEEEFKKTNSIVNSIIPGKILNEDGCPSESFYILEKVLKCLLCTNKSGLKIRI